MEATVENKGWPNVLKDEQLDVLNAWPEGTNGYLKEFLLIRLINQLCIEHGYGRVPQIAQHIQDIWYHPEQKIAQHSEIRKQRLEMLKVFEDIKDDTDSELG